jgi:2-hydroxychromene-2-carboxylate isomerase
MYPKRPRTHSRRPAARPTHPETLTETNLSTTVDYYFTPQSPWTYLGHERFAQIARAAGATVRVLPIDLGGKVFPISGGLPLGQRAPQRQAYRCWSCSAIQTTCTRR